MSPKRLVVALICSANLLFASAFAQTFPIKNRRKNIAGQMAIVYDERLSALRTQPHIKAPLIMRLRRDREVGIIGAPRGIKGAPQFYPVSISRNQRGWIIVEALARPQKKQDAERLMRLLDDTKDPFTRARLARLYADEFRGSLTAATALLKLGEAAEQASLKLSRDAKKRTGEPDEETDENLSQRDYLLNYVGLDRYNKIGVTFDYDETREQLIYDGNAYRELLRLYPRSSEAKIAKERLQALQK